MTEDDEDIYLNGISAITGEYLTPPISISNCVALVTQADLSFASVSREPVLALPPGRNPLDLSEAGWGIVFCTDESPEVRLALERLIEHRRGRVGNADSVRVLEYRFGETRASWLGRYGVAAGSPDPSKVPYYLLLVGSPQRIPFNFGFLLDVEYAVGRIGFDTSDEYARYVNSVIEYESRTGPIPSSKEILFFATEHPGDRATFLSSRELAHPLADCVPQLTSKLGASEQDGLFVSRKLLGTNATKQALTEALRSPDRSQSPIFFVATHGVGGWPIGDSKQLTRQGALLCQNWSGLGHIDSNAYFCASDIPSDARLFGVIAFLFACFSAGTPQYDRFLHGRKENPAVLANEPFFAKLPQSLLVHPTGGALACVGHVDRAWGYSIAPPNAGAQLLPFKNFLNRLLLGYPIGHAVQDFNHRYAILSADLADLLEMIELKGNVPDRDLSAIWTQRNDAEGYVVLGDPAVRLRVQDFYEEIWAKDQHLTDRGRSACSTGSRPKHLPVPRG